MDPAGRAGDQSRAGPPASSGSAPARPSVHEPRMNNHCVANVLARKRCSWHIAHANNNETTSGVVCYPEPWPSDRVLRAGGVRTVNCLADWRLGGQAYSAKSRDSWARQAICSYPAEAWVSYIAQRVADPSRLAEHNNIPPSSPPRPTMYILLQPPNPMYVATLWCCNPMVLQPYGTILCRTLSAAQPYCSTGVA
ncbi:hypothetical protein CALCODRAFT_66246 [Calocera cornea HHB12733]|uniref:Uncharacterized protein n=1 Tax=Calocera cornea HHB12733 TaxID=1353952 RepID=A0A165DJS9_9BASI|nr:hypothetical protein CALCODRAFT_66246 [Calocera cornea HHB12733]